MATDSTNWSRKRRCRSLSPPSRKARKGGPEETAGEVAVGILPTVSLGHVLLSSLEDGHFADVAVAIEGRGVVMKAHKIVLASGSEVFKTKLTNPQWAGVDPMKVSLPAGVSFDGAKVFIKVSVQCFVWVYFNKLLLTGENTVISVSICWTS